MIGSDADAGGGGVRIPWHIFWPLFVIVGTFVAPPLLGIFVIAGVGVWLARGHIRPLFVVMMLGASGGLARASIAFYALGQAHEAYGIKNRPRGWREETLEQARTRVADVYSEVIVPVALALALAVLLALVLEVLSRILARRPLQPFQPGRSIARMSRHQYWQLGAAGLVALLVPLVGRAAVSGPGISHAEALWLDLDDGIRHPGAFPNDSFPAVPSPPLNAQGIAVPCLSMAYVLENEDKTAGRASIDTGALAVFCSEAALERRDGFEDSATLIAFAKYACRAKTDRYRGFLGALPQSELDDNSRADIFLEQFCGFQTTSIVSVIPISSGMASTDSGEDFLALFQVKSNTGEKHGFMKKVDGRHLRSLWRTELEEHDAIHLTDRKVVRVSQRRIEVLALDTGASANVSFEFSDKVDDIFYNPDREWEGFVKLAGRTGVLIDLRAGSQKEAPRVPTWSSIPSNAPGRVRPCAQGLFTRSLAVCEVPSPSIRLPELPAPHTASLMLTDDRGDPVLLGQTEPSYAVAAGLDRSQMRVRWHRRVPTSLAPSGESIADMSHGRFVFGSRSLIALDAKSGDVLWELRDSPPDYPGRWDILALTETRAYIQAKGGGVLQVRDAKNGALLGTVGRKVALR